MTLGSPARANDAIRAILDPSHPLAITMSVKTKPGNKSDNELESSSIFSYCSLIPPTSFSSSSTSVSKVGMALRGAMMLWLVGGLPPRPSIPFLPSGIGGAVCECVLVHGCLVGTNMALFTFTAHIQMEDDGI